MLTENLEEKLEQAFIVCADTGTLDDVKKSFSSQDDRGDGFVAVSKFQRVLEDELDITLKPQERKIILRKLQARGNSNRIDYVRFLKTYSSAATSGNLNSGTSQETLMRKIQREFSRVASVEDKSEILRMFQAYDDDNEGNIRKRDFVIVLKEIGFKKLSRKEMDKLSRKFGLGEESDRIDYKEFLERFSSTGVEEMRQNIAKRLKRKIRARSTLYAKEQGRHIDLRGEFKAFDTSGSGTVSKQDFYQLVKEHGWNLTREETRWLFKKFDYENNGRISYVDFTRFASLDRRDIEAIEKRLKRIIQSKRKAGVKFSEQFEWFDTSGTGKISQLTSRRPWEP